MRIYKSPYGDFDESGKQFKITEREIPRNWYNYFWNNEYIAFASQVGLGEGFGQDTLGRRVALIKKRKVYVSDGAEFWSMDGLPVDRKLQRYECIHSLGETTIQTEYRDIQTSFTLFVPREGYTEIWLLKIKNNGEREKRLKITSYAATEVDGGYAPQGYNNGQGDYDKTLDSVVVQRLYEFDEKKAPVYGYMHSSEKVSGYDARHNTFIGPYDNDMAPRALKRGGLENNSSHAEKCCFALENTVPLKEGEEKSLVLVCGFGRERAEILKTVEKFDCVEKVEAELAAVRAHFEEIEKNVVIKTPIADLDKLWNYWLKHATVMGSRWARVRHNGIRDLTQDCQCLSVFNPALALENLKRVMRFQYSNGYMPRTVIDGEIKDKNFSDNGVWLADAVRSFVVETGNTDLLLEEVEYNDGRKGTVYEHVKKSIEWLYNFRGLYNLIKIWGGDWNDCMNAAGLQGKGVSVWLSIAWCGANDAFCELADCLGNIGDVELCNVRGQEMRSLINAHGWDGEYYITTYTDDGIKIGTHEDTMAKIFLMPQIWAIMANVCDEERKQVLLRSIEKYLKRSIGTLISDPGVSEVRDYFGDMSYKEPGIQENGGVYLQPICWKMIVDNLTKNPDEMAFDIQTLLPFTNPEVAGRGEPYILFNSYCTNPDNYRYGMPGQSWRTATGQWFVNVMVRYVFGFNPNFKGLRLTPCIPTDWEYCSITKTWRGATYEIEYFGCGCEIEKLCVNGEELMSAELPNEQGKIYKITVKMKR